MAHPNKKELAFLNCLIENSNRQISYHQEQILRLQTAKAFCEKEAQITHYWMSTHLIYAPGKHVGLLPFQIMFAEFKKRHSIHLEAEAVLLGYCLAEDLDWNDPKAPIRNHELLE